MDSIIPQDDTPLKQCTGPCGQWKPATNEFFSRMKTGRYGLTGTCKNCRNLAWRAKHPEAKPRRVEPDHPLPKGYKRCSKCRGEFPATSDYFQKHGNGGLQPRCKVCRSEGAAIYDSAHKEQRLAYSRHHYAINHDRISARKKRSRNAINARRRVRYQVPSVREGRLESNRKSNEKHGERRKVAFHIYYIAHREYYRMKDRERRAREKSVPGTHTVAQIEEQLKRQRHRCYYAACGFSKFPRVKKNGKWEYIFDVEHTFPVSRVSGTGIPANDMGYLVLSCHSCNQKKGKKFPHEWFAGGRLL